MGRWICTYTYLLPLYLPHEVYNQRIERVIMEIRTKIYYIIAWNHKNYQLAAEVLSLFIDFNLSSANSDGLSVVTTLNNSLTEIINKKI